MFTPVVYTLLCGDTNHVGITWYTESMLIFLDTETTGLIEPALVELAYNGVTLRCKPRKAIEVGASVVNGITNEDVAHLPLFRDMPEYATIKQQLENNTVVAHNAKYDVGVLNSEGIFPTDVVCTKELARKLLPLEQSHSLQYLRYSLNLQVKGIAHTASGDVAVLRALWERLHADGADSTSAV